MEVSCIVFIWTHPPTPHIFPGLSCEWPPPLPWLHYPLFAADSANFSSCSFLVIESSCWQLELSVLSTPSAHHLTHRRSPKPFLGSAPSLHVTAVSLISHPAFLPCSVSCCDHCPSSCVCLHQPPSLTLLCLVPSADGLKILL